MNDNDTPSESIPDPLLKRLGLWLFEWIKRHPRVLALGGFVSGLGSFFLVERTPALAQVIALLMLATWVWLMLENTLRRNALRLLNLKVPRPALQFVTQMVHQESLFFVLPFFFFTVTWNSGQLVFMALLSSAAIVSIVDPIYYNYLARRRWVYLGFHSLALFAVLLTALPIIMHLTTAQSYPLALGSALVLAIPSIIKALPRRRWWRGLALFGVLLVLGVCGWFGRLWVPPATLWLTDVSISYEVDALEKTPGRTIRELSSEQLHRNGLYAYTAIRAPRGLNERIYHVWIKDGQLVDKIALDIQGGRSEGYRAWTHKENFPERAPGHWQVQVVTEANQMIGVLRFEVIENSDVAANF